jgi:hypothetical protein
MVFICFLTYENNLTYLFIKLFFSLTLLKTIIHFDGFALKFTVFLKEINMLLEPSADCQIHFPVHAESSYYKRWVKILISAHLKIFYSAFQAGSLAIIDFAAVFAAFSSSPCVLMIKLVKEFNFSS